MSIHPLLKSKGVKPRKGKVFSCRQCGEEFYLGPYRANRKQATGNKFCSKKCFSEYLKTNDPLHCIVCGNEFYVSISQERDRNRKTCSWECRLKYIKQSGIQSGENCHFWRGGVSSQNRLLRYSAQMKKWRNEVFKRDNYTCQSCGIKGVYLEAHHVKPFSSFPELRFEVNNGKTLCRDCHDLTKSERRKLNLNQIEAIKQDTRTLTTIAKDYEVSKSLIWNVKNL